METKEIPESGLLQKIKDFVNEGVDIEKDILGCTDYAEWLSLTEEDIPELKKLMKLWLKETENPEDQLVWDIAATAWRAIAELNLFDSVQALFELLEESEKTGIENELISMDLSEAGSIADKATVTFLCDLVQGNLSYNDYTVLMAVECLENALDVNHDMKSIIKESMKKRLERYENNSAGVNAFLIDGLTKLEAVDTAEIMEKAFAAGKVDESHIGIWGDIRKELGVPGLGLVADDVRVTPDPWKEFAEKMNELAELRMLKEKMQSETPFKASKKQKKKKKKANKVRKLKRKKKRK